MALQVCSLNSGSNGNCYYIGNSHEAILVDAGLSCRETERRMGSLGLSLKKVIAILVSHEHTDHIKGLQQLSSKHRIPVYLTSKTLEFSRLQLNRDLLRSFSPGNASEIGSFSVTGFKKYHDAADPHSFVIRYNNVTVGVFTDIGKCCSEVQTFFSKCNAVFLESNYDEDMLATGSYPIFLKKRITGGQGHLSNREALDLFKAYRNPFLSHIFLSHLSRENNCPEKAIQTFLPHAQQTQVVVASRYKPTEVFTILPNNGNSSTKTMKPTFTQLSIF